MPRAATPPTSPVPSSPNSTPASATPRKGTTEAAALAAARTFSQPSSLPLHNQSQPTSEATVGRRALRGAWMIELDRIEPDPEQPRRRLDPEPLAELTKSVAELGVLTPISVRYVAEANRYRIIAGERRFTAAINAGLKDIPCWVKEPEAEKILLEQIAENWQRSELNPFDLADALAVLRDSNHWTQEDVARHIGKSPGQVSKVFSLLDLDPQVQTIARDDSSGRYGLRHLYSVSRLPIEQQKRLMHRMQRNALPAADLERLVSRMLEPKQAKTATNLSHRRYVTAHGTVLLSFKKKYVVDEDVLALLSEVRRHVLAEQERSR